MKRAKMSLILALALALGLATEVANADFIFGKAVNLGPIVNSSSSDGSPDICADGLSLYFDSRRAGGQGDWDIWVTTRTANGDWGEPVPLPWPINTAYADAGPSISADGLTLYFASDRPGGLGSFDLWVTTRETMDDPWDAPANLGSKVNSSSYDNHPAISADGLSLYFDSARPGGLGYDIWMTKRSTLHSAWGTPVNLGWAINDVSIELSPSIHSGGLVLFFDSRILDRDILMARRRSPDEPWDLAVYLEPPVNTWDFDTDPSVAADGSMLYFASDRPGGVGGQDLWQVPIFPVVDFNGDQIVNLKDFAMLAQYWQEDDLSVDIGPTPLGDMFVDVWDAAVFAQYWLTDLRLVAHCKLDETAGTVAQDSAGGYNGILHGEPIWQPTAGKVNGALQLDGADDYVGTPFILDPAAGAFSVFAWVKGCAAGQVIISQTGGANWLLASAATGALVTELKSAGRFGKSLSSQAVIADGDWHRVAFVWDGFNRKLFVDGVEVAKDTQDGLATSEGGLQIGAGKNLDPGSFWTGLIDDIRIYDRAVKP